MVSRFLRSFFYGLLVLVLPFSISAAPISMSDRSSFNRLNGLPAPKEAFLLDRGVRQHAMQFELTSQFALDNTQTDFVLIDGETAELNYALRWGIGERMEITVDLPWLHQSGGSFDGFVENWHNYFNLPNGGRENFEQDQLRYEVNTADVNFLTRENSAGLGDIALGWRYQLIDSTDHALSFNAYLELPTGDEQQLLGSGSTDIASSLSYSLSDGLGSLLKHVHAEAGLLWFGDTKILSSVSNEIAYFGSLSTRSELWWRWNLDLQLQMHSRMYDLPTEPFENPVLMGSFALAKAIANNYEFRIGITEDLITKTSPDFTVFFSLSTKPQ